MSVENQNHGGAVAKDDLSLKDLLIKIQEWWRYLLSKWLIILVFGLIGSSLGLIFALYKKPVYTASTTFVLEDEKSGGVGNLAGLASMAGLDIGGSGGGIFQGENILQLYKSRTILSQTLLTKVNVGNKDQLLVDYYIEFNKLRKGWDLKPELKNFNFVGDTTKFTISKKRLRDSILGEIVSNISKGNLTVSKPDKKLSTIQVDVKSQDELFSKMFNDVLVRNVSNFYVLTKTKKTLQNVRILQNKADSVRAVMNGAIYTAVAVADATPNLNPTRQVQRVAPAQRAQFSAETNKSILSEMVKNLEMTKMALLKETPLIQVIDQPIYPLKKEKFSKAKGILLGGIFGGIIICTILIIRRILKLILA